MPNKMMMNNTPKRATTHPLTARSMTTEPTAINGKKVSPKIRNKPTYSHTLNNYESIRNLVTLNSHTNLEAPPTETDTKRVHIKV